MRLTGKVVLITNVSQYMGLACVEEFAKEGAVLAVHDRTEARAQPALELARAHGREASVVTGDLTVSGEATRAVRAVAERHGRLDVLVNNSSHPPVGGPVDEVSDETWRSMAAHLYDEPFFCLRAAIRVMKRQGHGKVVNLTSAVAIPGLPNYTAYSAARAGANGLTRAVGREVARHNIRSTRSRRTSSRTRPTSAPRSPRTRTSSPASSGTSPPADWRGPRSPPSCASSWPRARPTSSAAR
jgi:NAD(P)-dependent dehydrogenase (short-subunit alcohol dehydrogenase family)